MSMHKRILVCDDHEGILDMLSILLENYDFEITVEKIVCMLTN